MCMCMDVCACVRVCVRAYVHIPTFIGRCMTVLQMRPTVVPACTG